MVGVYVQVLGGGKGYNRRNRVPLRSLFIQNLDLANKNIKREVGMKREENTYIICLCLEK